MHEFVDLAPAELMEGRHGAVDGHSSRGMGEDGPGLHVQHDLHMHQILHGARPHDHAASGGGDGEGRRRRLGAKLKNPSTTVDAE